MLLNIVRSRYYEVPVFLDLGQIVSGYTLQSTVSVTGTAGPSGESATAAAGGSWSDHPTITYTPLTGAQFNRNMMTPIPPSAVLFSIQSGWPADLVLSLAVSSINGVSSSFDPARFDRTASLARALQLAQVIGMRVQPSEREQVSVVLFFRTQTLTAEQEAMLKELQDILRLDPNRSEFAVIFGLQRSDAEIALTTRSVLQMLGELGSYVEVPEADVREGRATPGRTIETVGVGQLRIKYSREQPADPVLRVAHRGGWFWIDDRDLMSKATFGVLMLISTLAETGAREGLPLVTIPAR
jgi:hypothetical protein